MRPLTKSALIPWLFPACLGMSTSDVAWAAGQVISGQLPPITKHVEPTYPSEAREKRIQGVVLVRITVGTDGRVTDATSWALSLRWTPRRLQLYGSGNSIRGA